MAIKSTFKKSDRVEYDSNGTIKYGTVEKGGASQVVIILDGGKLQTTLPPHEVRLSTHPYPKDTIVTPLDNYEIRDYKSGPGHVPGFAAEIWKDGVRIAFAENSGRGGCDMYRGHHAVVSQFEADAAAWAAALGFPDQFEPAGLWILWYVEGRPYGATAKQYIEDYNQS